MIYKFELEEKDAQVVLDALLELPFKKVADIICLFRKQECEQAEINKPPKGGGEV